MLGTPIPNASYLCPSHSNFRITKRMAVSCQARKIQPARNTRHVQVLRRLKYSRARRPHVQPAIYDVRLKTPQDAREQKGSRRTTGRTARVPDRRCKCYAWLQ